jgi:adenylate cyclase
MIIGSMVEAGLPLEALAAAVQRGILSLDFVDLPVYAKLAALSHETFAAVTARTGVPQALLFVIREAFGGGNPQPFDVMRDDELAVVPFVEVQLRLGIRVFAIERLLRAMGDSLHRLAEAEAEWFRSEVVEPRLAAGKADEIGQIDTSVGLTRLEEQAMLAIYGAHQGQSWISNMIGGFGYLLNNAGLYHPPDRPPAICFLDITGYTRLTEERGDRAAAELAEELARVAKRTSVQYGGRPVKWLGDGVMFYFRDPGPAVVSALEMVDGIAQAGLPPAHVGLHAGPVIIQQGDYYGQTVNLASRIAEYARPREVLVSQSVVDAAGDAPVAFADIGPVELKGVAGPARLFGARRAEP